MNLFPASTMPAAVLLFATFVCAAEFVAHSQYSAAPLDLLEPAWFICGTSLDRLRLRPAALSDAEVLGYYQVPDFITPDFSGRVELRNFEVLGDYPSIRIYYLASRGYQFDEFQRVVTRSVDGRLISVFAPAWNMNDFVVRMGGYLRVSYGAQQMGPLLLQKPGTTIPPGAPGAMTIPLYLWGGPSGIPPTQVQHIDGEIQYSSHVVNIVASAFGDGRVSGGAFAVELADVARLFYSHFEDGYDVISVVAQETPVSFAFHRVVKNDISGVGLVPSDDSSVYGSDGVLKGVEFFPHGLSNTISNHELAHQWGDYWDWQRIADVRVTDRGHTPLWGDYATPIPSKISPWLELKSISSLEVTRWQARQVAAPRYPPLLLYAMGRLSRDQVPTVTLFRDQTQPNIFLPGQYATGDTVTRSIDDVAAIHGDRSGPVIDRWRRATIVVSRSALLSKRAMDAWTFYARRIEDPFRAGVVDDLGIVSWDIATGADLQADIRPRSLPPLDGLGVVEPPFAVTDVRGARFDNPPPSVVAPDREITVTGVVSADSLRDAVELVLRFQKPRLGYENVNDVVEIRGSINATSRSFLIPMRFTGAQRGAYSLIVQANVAGRIATLGRVSPFVVR